MHIMAIFKVFIIFFLIILFLLLIFTIIFIPASLSNALIILKFSLLQIISKKTPAIVTTVLQFSNQY